MMFNWLHKLLKPKVTDWQEGWDYAELCFASAPESIALWRIGHTELHQPAEWQRGVTDFINRRKDNVTRLRNSSQYKYNKSS